MPTPRVVTFTDVTQGRLYIDPVLDGNLTIQRDYQFVSIDPLALQIPKRSFATTVAWADVPQNIRDALVAIDSWTYDQILEQENMDGIL